MSSAVMSFASSWFGGGASDDDDDSWIGSGEDVYCDADETTRAPLETLEAAHYFNDPTRTATRVGGVASRWGEQRG